MEPISSTTPPEPPLIPIESHGLTEDEVSRLEMMIDEVFQFNQSNHTPENQKTFEKLRQQINLYDRKNVPQKLRSRLKLAKNIFFQVSKIQFLLKESKNAIEKANSTVANINRTLDEMKQGMDIKAFNVEKQRRLLPVISRLADVRDKILSEDAKELQRYPEVIEVLNQINQILDRIDLIDIDKARAIHGLHLEGDLPVGFERMVETSVREYQLVASLDVNENGRIKNVPHAILDTYRGAVTKEQRFAPQLYIPHDSIAIKPQSQENQAAAKFHLEAVNIETTEHIHNQIHEDVKQFSMSTDYNSWATISDFIDYSNELKRENPAVTPLQAFQKFDPHENRVHEFGDACTGQSMAILDHLEKKYNLKGYLIVQKEGVTGVPMHTAAVIPCKDGILLIEMLNKEQPVIAIRANQVSKAKSFGDDCTFSLELEAGQYPKLVKKATIKENDGSVITYETEFPLLNLNPKAVMLRYMVERVDYVLMSEKHEYSILVNMHDGKITFKKGFGKNAERQKYSFADLNSTKINLEIEEFCKKIQMQPEQVKAMLRKFADNQQVVKALLGTTRTPIPTF